MPFQQFTYGALKSALAFRLDNSAFYSAAECGTYINEAIRVWQCITGYWRTSTTLTTGAGTIFYNVAAATPRILKPLRVTASSVPLDLTSLFALDNGRPGWQGDTNATPLRWAPVAISHIALHPPPTAGLSVVVYGWAAAPVLVADADFIDINEAHLEALYKYAHHIAAFKAAGTEFQNTTALLQDFYRAAGEQNDKFKLSSLYRKYLGRDLNGAYQPVHVPRAQGAASVSN